MQFFSAKKGQLLKSPYKLVIRSMLLEKKFNRCFDLLLKKKFTEELFLPIFFWLNNFDLFTENTNPLLKKFQRVMQKSKTKILDRFIVYRNYSTEFYIAGICAKKWDGLSLRIFE